MKRILWTVLVAGVLAAGAFYVKRPQVISEAPAGAVAETGTTQAGEAPGMPEPPVVAPERLLKPAVQASSPQPVQQANKPGAEASKGQLDAVMISQKIEGLVSPLVSYGQKQAAWKELRDNGKLDLAITALEQRMAAEPGVAAYPATLGQAYFAKCAGLKDVREQAILAMQADKLFDTALNIDAANWEARFNKAVAMSYWPASMNKGPEVVQHFTTLIEQQEAQAPQPQFADSYVLLGKEYQKTGQNDYARMVWERGAGLFPNNDRLKEKLAAQNQ